MLLAVLPNGGAVLAERMKRAQKSTRGVVERPFGSSLCLSCRWSCPAAVVVAPLILSVSCSGGAPTRSRGALRSSRRPKARRRRGLVVVPSSAARQETGCLASGWFGRRAPPPVVAAAGARSWRHESPKDLPIHFQSSGCWQQKLIFKDKTRGDKLLLLSSR